ncbi:MAG: cytochrome c [Terracidiphilus sp.]
MGRLLFGIIVGILLAPAALLAWFRYGHPPVAVADPPLYQERAITEVPLHARIDREMPAAAPIQASEENLVAGAQVYAAQCAACHGFHGKPSSFGAHMYPDAPPLWEKHHNGDVVGVSDDPVGETYWKVANGIRLTGMPAFKDVLNDTQMWQVSLLLANANKTLPQPAMDILAQPLNFALPTPAAPTQPTPAQQAPAPK